MNGSSKPMASLSSNLLARKGQAKPAMRPQGFVGLSPATAHDDLGWNDMGDEPAPQPQPELQSVPVRPVVLRQIEAIEEQIAQASAPEPEPVVAPAPRPVAPAAVAKGGKAAFTLRLDTERHLRLRLASALTNRSAQLLVTEALDAFLESQTEVEALARQIGPAKGSWVRDLP